MFLVINARSSVGRLIRAPVCANTNSMITSLTCVLMFCAPKPVGAEVLISETYKYYFVSGHSTEELRTAIDSSRRDSGVTFDATTNWSISWQYDFLSDSSSCRITTINVNVDIEYQLPRWPERDTHHNAELRNTWKAYYEKLLQHELKHGRIAKQAGYKIESAIRGSHLETANCKPLEALANRNATSIIEQSKQEHYTFDQSTNHGASTGAVFP